MKKLMSFILFLFICSSIQGQCPQGDIILETQLEVNNFAANYPSCTEITGYLRIGVLFGDSDITDLSNLPPIELIGGDLRILRVDLTNLSALGNLISVGGDLEISYDYALTDLSGLENLTSVGGSLEIVQNNALTDLSGLENLTSAGGSLNISANHILTDISALGNLTSIDDDLWIWENLALMDLSGLENLTSVGNEFRVADNTALTDLSGLENLTSIGGEMGIWENLVLMDLSGLENLTSIGGHLRIAHNYNLTNLSGLENLTSIGDFISIYNNFNLMDISALGNLTSFGGGLGIALNRSLSICEIPFICDYLSNGGDSSINNNDLGCNSANQILDACMSLPIEMTAPLRVYLDGQIAILRWRTDTETNNTGFEVQRSKDGINWEKIGWQAGQGTTTTPHTYTHRDPNPLSGISYYRLKQVDFDGDFEYSNAVSLRYIPVVVEISPNPNNGTFKIKGTPQGTYQIHDTTGRIIQSGNMKNDLSIDISQEAQGVYFISIQMENETITKRIIKM